ncbi:putative E3 ubiquitin-protein ligase DTX2 [Pundamilia nyererei]|uniref:E3 ubiquitin-protein ligase n=1 Tax=Pundamilia nyererei TaxID=303518 RepID=A0A9Y6J7A0_9CICH|nr:PREDICTED: probable E3 ubiquitin-protein ligase DTX2 [Pundamilia nyererei]
MAIVSGSCARVNGSRNGPPVSATPSGSVGQSQPMIAVWEWQDDQGYWRPYSGQVSAYIERCLSPRGHRGGAPGSTSICLGQSDPSLSPYLIDIPSLKQFRQDTGKTRSVRRSLFAQSSGLGSGVYWEWANDEGGWTPYETRTSILLEHSYQARQGTADLGPHGYNYIVDLTSLAQVNKSTGFRRQVRRQCNLPYPLASSGPPLPVVFSLFGSRLQLSVAHCVALLGHCAAWGSLRPICASKFPGGVPSISVQLNGSTSVSSALAGMASILMSAVGLGVHFTSAPLPQQQQQHPPPQHQQPAPFSLPPPPPLLPPASRPIKPHSSSSSTSTSSSVRRAKRQHRRDLYLMYLQDCIICMDQLSNPSGYETPSTEEGGQSIQPDTVGKFIKCGHTLHMLCMLAMYNNGTKCIKLYNLTSVTLCPCHQGPEHPNPGQPYTCRGFPRFCFLPDNDKGRKVLELLKVAWMRRLIFTVGTSSTTGEPDTVVWNGIHHKTEMMSNLSGHGYPDPNYLDNVLSELASQGVTEDCLKPPGSGSGAS